MTYDDPARWAEIGISRPDLRGGSEETPGDPVATITAAHELPDGHFGFQFDVGRDEEERFMLVHFAHNGEDLNLNGSGDFELTFVWISGEGNNEIPTALQQAAVEALNYVGQEDCWRKLGVRRVDIEQWLMEEFGDERLFDILSLFQLQPNHFAMRVRLRSEFPTELTLQAFYFIEGETARYQWILPENIETEARSQLSQVLDMLGEVHLDQHCSIASSRRRLDFLGPLLGQDDAIVEGFTVADGGICEEGSAWLKVRCVLGDGTTAEFFSRVNFEGVNEFGTPNYCASIASRGTALIDGRDAPMHAVLYHTALCLETDRRAAKAKPCDCFVGLSETFTDTLWSQDGDPSEVEATLRVVEAREGDEGNFFYRLLFEQGSSLPVEIVMGMVVNTSFDESRRETWQTPAFLSDRGQLFKALRRVIARIRKMQFRASKSSTPKRRARFENITVELAKANGASRDIELRTIECLDYGNYELHITVELRTDLGDSFTALTAFRNFTFTGGESRFEMRILVSPIEDVEMQAMDMLAQQVASRVAADQGLL